ncbi:hypothetical protein CONPUDRAFT_56015, partial [Coniophora puteana RWD-64-598 SS2]
MTPIYPQDRSDAWQSFAQACAQGAIYDSNERQPHIKCLPDTRIDLHQRLKTMAQDKERSIIWLVGKVDSGKTAVLHTLADELRQEDRLAGTFFFSSAHPKRNSFDYVFPTLAYQLAIQHPRAQEAITKAIATDPALLLAEKSRQDQLEKLFIPP